MRVIAKAIMGKGKRRDSLDRPLVIIETEGGMRAYYQSSGNSTTNCNRGTWIPFAGAVYGWVVKVEYGKHPQEENDILACEYLTENPPDFDGAPYFHREADLNPDGLGWFACINKWMRDNGAMEHYQFEVWGRNGLHWFISFSYMTEDYSEQIEIGERDMVRLLNE